MTASPPSNFNPRGNPARNTSSPQGDDDARLHTPRPGRAFGLRFWCAVTLFLLLQALSQWYLRVGPIFPTLRPAVSTAKQPVPQPAQSNAKPQSNIPDTTTEEAKSKPVVIPPPDRDPFHHLQNPPTRQTNPS
jgi:hypothetical protein